MMMLIIIIRMITGKSPPATSSNLPPWPSRPGPRPPTWSGIFSSADHFEYVDSHLWDHSFLSQIWGKYEVLMGIMMITMIMMIIKMMISPPPAIYLWSVTKRTFTKTKWMITKSLSKMIIRAHPAIYLWAVQKGCGKVLLLPFAYHCRPGQNHFGDINHDWKASFLNLFKMLEKRITNLTRGKQETPLGP